MARAAVKCEQATDDAWAVRWLDGTDVRLLILDHHAFHEDAKPGDLSLQLGTRRFNSSNQFWTRMSSASDSTSSFSSSIRSITKR